MTDTKCPLLWNHMHVALSGVHSPCCHVKYYKENGSWQDQNWGKFDPDLGILSEHHKQAREQMRRGERVSLCEVCYRREDLGNTSPRLDYLADSENSDVDYDSEPTSIKTMDIKFNNTCNLGCRMCDPSSSSYLNKDLSFIPQQDRINKEETFDQFDDADKKLAMSKMYIAKGLSEFKTTGGEPFLQKQFIELVDWCLANGYNKDLKMKLTTNLLMLNEKLMKKLIQFKHLHITVSCDGTGSVYEYIRYPAKWENFQRAFDVLQKYNQTNVSMNMASILQIYNLFDLENIFKFTQDRIRLGVDWDLNPDGSELSVELLPKDILQFAYDSQPLFFKQNKLVGRYLLDVIENNKSDEQKLKEFCRKTIILDKHRKQDYKQSLHASIVELINTTNGE